MFEHVDAYPGDPILSLLEGFTEDKRPNKVNVSIGLYYDDQGRIPVLKSVAEAQERVDRKAPHTYLPMDGIASFRESVGKLVFGEDASVRERTAMIQSIGGSGAIHVAARFIKKYFPESKIWISDPTWDNHRVLIEAAGVPVETYPYYDPVTQGIKFGEMLALFETLPEKSVVLLQPSCHNPTGVDLRHDQWKEIARVLRARKLIAFMDMAYQGFGNGLEEDAWPIRLFAEANIPMFVSTSFSKNFSLYGQRVGALAVVCQRKEQAVRVQGQLKSIVRQVYSSPPAYGAQIVSAVLNDKELFLLWSSEVQQMRSRLGEMRSGLRKILEALAPNQSWKFLTDQKGMFSYTGLSAQDVDRLRIDHGVYLVRSGRLCLTGLTTANLASVADAIVSVAADRTGTVNHSHTH